MRISDWSSDVCSSDLRVEIARAQHRARISAFAATTVMGLEYRFDVSAHAFRDREGRNEGLLGRKTNEQVAPDGIELVVEDPPHHAASRLPGLSGDIPADLQDRVGCGFLTLAVPSSRSRRVGKEGGSSFMSRGP